MNSDFLNSKCIKKIFFKHVNYTLFEIVSSQKIF